MNQVGAQPLAGVGQQQALAHCGHCVGFVARYDRVRREMGTRSAPPHTIVTSFSHLLLRWDLGAENTPTGQPSPCCSPLNHATSIQPQCSASRSLTPQRWWWAHPPPPSLWPLCAHAAAPGTPAWWFRPAAAHSCCWVRPCAVSMWHGCVARQSMHHGCYNATCAESPANDKLHETKSRTCTILYTLLHSNNTKKHTRFERSVWSQLVSLLRIPCKP